MEARSSRSLPANFQRPHSYVEVDRRSTTMGRLKSWLRGSVGAGQSAPRRPLSTASCQGPVKDKWWKTLFSRPPPSHQSCNYQGVNLRPVCDDPNVQLRRRRPLSASYCHPNCPQWRPVSCCPTCGHHMECGKWWPAAPPLPPSVQEEDEEVDEVGSTWYSRLPPPPPVPTRTYELSNMWTEELHRLAKCGWYWGPLSRDDAKKKLDGLADGCFLVRDSSDEYQLLSLYVRSVGKTLHLRIIYAQGRFSFHAQKRNPVNSGSFNRYRSVVELIEQTVKASEKKAVFYSKPQRFTLDDDVTIVQTLSYPIRLTTPVSRFTEVRSLQFLCRFVVRLNTRIDLLAQLPLPRPMIGYVQEGFFA